MITERQAPTVQFSFSTRFSSRKSAITSFCFRRTQPHSTAKNHGVESRAELRPRRSIQLSDGTRSPSSYATHIVRIGVIAQRT
jgi:hypothetical protein